MSDATSNDKFGLLRSFLRHRGFVGDAVERVADELRHRVRVHDLSKMMDDEFEGFARINAAARINKFGSPEYAEGMQRERPTIDLHFSRNSHHPEYPKLVHEKVEREYPGPEESVVKMTFLDVIEMVCDWWGARLGYDDPRSWSDSVELNLASKGKYLTREQLWLVREVATFLGGK